MGPLKTHYLDASAIVKLFVDEDGSQIIREYINKHAIFHTTSLCFAEALGVLKAKYFYRKKISEEQYLRASTNLLIYVLQEAIKIKDIDIAHLDVIREVRELVKKYSIDISDAFQIYSLKKGILSVFGGDSQPILITADKKLAKAVKAEGLTVWNFLKEDQ